MRELSCSNVQLSTDEYIVCEKETRGTETSKYPEEKKTTVIPRVVASEIGGAQTVHSTGLRTTIKHQHP